MGTQAWVIRGTTYRLSEAKEGSRVEFELFRAEREKAKAERGSSINFLFLFLSDES